MDEDDEDEEYTPPQSQSYEEPSRRGRRNTRSGETLTPRSVDLRSKLLMFCTLST